MASLAETLKIFFLTEHCIHYIVPIGEANFRIDDSVDVVNLNVRAGE
jgi:hypothetical protein